MARALTRPLVLAAVLAALLAESAGAAGLPRPAELERATARFLAAHPAPAPRPGASGGIGGAPATAVTLPADRVVAFYGAPQMGRTILGLRSPAGAARELAAQASPYEAIGDRPVVGAFDLVAAFATAAAGSDRLYRTRQDPRVIGIYLAQARRTGARLMLDVQPGRSTYLAELEALAPWLAEPDVDLALDPEWNVGRRGVPGQTRGRVRAKEVNAVSRALAAIVREHSLPPKLLVVHQFRPGMIRGRRALRPRRGVQLVLNFDGIGTPGPKAAGYEALSVPRLFDGFSLFYDRDEPVMRPRAVLALDPAPDLLLYQ